MIGNLKANGKHEWKLVKCIAISKRQESNFQGNHFDLQISYFWEEKEKGNSLDIGCYFSDNS